MKQDNLIYSMKETKLDVPFFSQYSKEVPEEWRERACGITSLRMVLAHIFEATGKDVPNTSSLIEETTAIDGWEKCGIEHEAIIRLAHNHGVSAYREEWRSVEVDPKLKTFVESSFAGPLLSFGFDKLRSIISEGRAPIVSISVDDKENSHLVPLVGATFDGWYYHDPAEHDAKPGNNIFISNDEFERRFRKFAIFISPIA